MNFALAFGRTLIWRPHRALGALYWYLTGRKIRARNRLRLAAGQSYHAYTQWMSSVEQLHSVATAARRISEQWKRHPSFTVLIYADETATPRAISDSLQSIRKQFYGKWDLIISASSTEVDLIAKESTEYHFLGISNAADAFNRGITLAKGEYVLPLRAGDRLSPAALFRYAELLQDQQAEIVYGDEDQLSRRGRRMRPWFKPDWNEEMFLAQDYLSSACIIRTDAAQAALPIEEGFSATVAFTLALRIATRKGGVVRHVAHIVCHRAHDVRQYPPDERAAVVTHHLADQNAVASGGDHASVRVIWPLPETLPKVSIIVPTRDKVKLLRACVDGVLATTSYPDFEVIVVDNGSVEAATHFYLENRGKDPRVRVLHYDAPYNYSAINNFAAAHAAGDYVCLLNNDTEVLHPDWLTEMMRQAARPHVGAVGAKLLYPDGSIQHAGVIIGLGEAAGHAHRFLRKGRAGYFNQAHIAQYVSAVTAACLLVEKRKFEAVGGLDADSFAIAFNDVDLCLKLEAAGWRNVYTPYAVLIHHESKSRGKDISPQHITRYLKELAVLQDRWGTKGYRDPLHNPNLNPAHETFSIRLW